MNKQQARKWLQERKDELDIQPFAGWSFAGTHAWIAYNEIDELFEEGFDIALSYVVGQVRGWCETEKSQVALIVYQEFLGAALMLEQERLR